MKPIDPSRRARSDEEVDLPLAGMLVLDFSQFLAGPVAAMRLADLGARVIKVERPGVGDIGRQLAFAGRYFDGETVSFHSMNRNKQSVTADLKLPADLEFVRRLVRRADVLIQNFRPGVMQRIGLDYESVRQLNPQLVYASASGYGDTGPWKDRPGQDLLAQAVSGLPWLSGANTDGPVPVGISVADHLMSCHIAQGVTALLLRRERTNRGGLVETSLLEASLDLQFELLGAYLNDDSVIVRRGGPNSAHAFLPAPYGTYPTRDGHLALAMNSVSKLGELLEVPELAAMADVTRWWEEREEIEALLAERFRLHATEHWLGILDAADMWCAPVLTLGELVNHEAFAAIDMTQRVSRDTSSEQVSMTVTRSPIRVDGSALRHPLPAPRLGEHTDLVREEFESAETM